MLYGCDIVDPDSGGPCPVVHEESTQKLTIIGKAQGPNVKT